jgi:hypothetical protein
MERKRKKDRQTERHGETERELDLYSVSNFLSNLHILNMDKRNV